MSDNRIRRAPKALPALRSAARCEPCLASRPQLALALWLCCATLFGCSSPDLRTPSPVDEEYARLEAGARNAHSRGELSYAAELYESLLVEAERTDDPSKIGDSSYNLAVCRLALGEWDAARELLTIAEHELERAGEALAGTRIVRARLELLAGRPAACELAAASVLAKSAQGASAREQSEAWVLRGLAALRLGETAKSEAALQEARAASNALEAQPSQVRLEAELHVAAERWPEAAEAFDEAASLERKLSRYSPMASALEFAGDAWRSAGRQELAHDRWLRSASARFAGAIRRGSPAQIRLRELGAAALLCERLDDAEALAGDPYMLTRVRTLVERIDSERIRVEGLIALVEAERQLGEVDAD